MSPRRRKRPLISANEWKWFWIGTLALMTLAGGGTALYAWLTKPEEPKNLLPAQSPFKEGVDDTILETPLLTDFDLPAPGGQWLDKPWLSDTGGRARPWTLDEVSPYWVGPEDLSVLKLPQTNAAAIDKLLGSVP